MLRIRLQRLGRRNRALYRIVLTDARVKRQGKYIEKLGSYDPIVEKDEAKVTVDIERVKHWVGQGAQPSDSVTNLLKTRGLNLAALAAGKKQPKGKVKAAGA